ncbi:MAG: DUF2141 domain-containing protein, partial [Planctomycetota bacterium]
SARPFPIRMPQQKPPEPSLWHDSHGNLLVGVLIAVLVVGFAVIGYQRSQFVPPRFPTAKSIDLQAPAEELEPLREEPAAEQADTPTNETAKPDPTDDDGDQAGIEILVRGATSDMGVVLIAIYDDAESFNQPTKSYRKSNRSITNGEATWTLGPDDLPKRLSIASFHDVNQDGVLNRNALGMPTEPYGFSNQARALLGPPAFEATLVPRPAPGNKIIVVLK